MKFDNKRINLILFTGIFFSTIAGLIGITIPLQLKNIIDNKKSFFNLNGTISILVLAILFILQAFITSIGLYMTSKAGEKYVNYFRKNIFEYVLKLPISFFDNFKSGEISGRIINDTSVIREFLTLSLPNFISSIIIFFGSLVMLYFLDFKLSILLTLMLPILLIIVLPLSRLTEKYSKQKQNILNRVVGSMGEYFSQIRLIKSTQAEKNIINKEKKEIDAIYNVSLKDDLINSLINPCVFLFLFSVVAVIFGYGGLRVENNDLTVGTLVSFLIYLFQMLNPISYLANFSSKLHQMKGATEKIGHYMKLAVEDTSFIEYENEIYDNSIKLHKIYFSYNHKYIFNDLNLEFPSGLKTAIVGPSGSGKTTILNLIERFYTPNYGEIFLGNIDSNKMDLKTWRSNISLVLQDNSIISGTIRDNLLLGLDIIPDNNKIRDALIRSFLYEKVSNLPNGLETFIGERGVKLSGGEKQRLQIARVFLQNPKILMLDEATSNLDSDSENIVSKALDNINKNTTRIVVAHRLSTITDSDKIYFIDNGKVSGVGTHSELLKNHSKYKKYVEEQFINKK